MVFGRTSGDVLRDDTLRRSEAIKNSLGSGSTKVRLRNVATYLRGQISRGRHINENRVLLGALGSTRDFNLAQNRFIQTLGRQTLRQINIADASRGRAKSRRVRKQQINIKRGVQNIQIQRSAIQRQRVAVKQRVLGTSSTLSKQRTVLKSTLKSTLPRAILSQEQKSAVTRGLIDARKRRERASTFGSGAPLKSRVPPKSLPFLKPIYKKYATDRRISNKVLDSISDIYLKRPTLANKVTAGLLGLAPAVGIALANLKETRLRTLELAATGQFSLARNYLISQHKKGSKGAISAAVDTLRDPTTYLFIFATPLRATKFSRAVKVRGTKATSKSQVPHILDTILLNPVTKKAFIADYRGVVRVVSYKGKQSVAKVQTAVNRLLKSRVLQSKTASFGGTKARQPRRAPSIATPKKSLKQRKPLSKVSKSRNTAKAKQFQAQQVKSLSSKSLLEITKKRQTDVSRITDNLSKKQLKKLYSTLTTKSASNLKKGELKRLINRNIKGKVQRGGIEFGSPVITKGFSKQLEFFAQPAFSPKVRGVLQIAPTKRLAISAKGKLFQTSKRLGKLPKSSVRSQSVVSQSLVQSRVSNSFVSSKTGQKTFLLQLKRGQKVLSFNISNGRVSKALKQVPKNQIINSNIKGKVFTGKPLESIVKSTEVLRQKTIGAPHTINVQGRGKVVDKILARLRQKAADRKNFIIVKQGTSKQVYAVTKVKARTKMKVSRTISKKKKKKTPLASVEQRGVVFELEFTPISAPLNVRSGVVQSPVLTFKGATKVIYRGKTLPMVKIGRRYVLKTSSKIAQALLSDLKVLSKATLKNLLRQRLISKAGLLYAVRSATVAKTLTRQAIAQKLKAVPRLVSKGKSAVTPRPIRRPPKKPPARPPRKPPRKPPRRPPKRPPKKPPARPPRAPPRKPPRRPPKRPPKKPPVVPKFPLLKPELRIIAKAPYSVFIRRKGKDIKFNPRPVLGKDVRRLARWVVNNHIAASYTIRRAKGKPVSLKSAINAPASYFRKPKGKSSLKALSRVERRKFRLNTQTEKKQISLAKLRKLAFAKPKKRKKRKTIKRKKP